MTLIALRSAVVAMRPRQWTKNLLLFAGLVFARRLDDKHAWLHATVAFGLYCAASSAAYLVNDVRDAEHDRHHRTKRDRPVAARLLTEHAALAIAAALALAALAGGAALGLWSLALVALFLAVQLAYSLGLKRIVGVDLLLIAGLFVIRAVAGAVAVHVYISGWLIGCTIVLSLFLGLSKRRAELHQVAAGTTPGRPVLRRYATDVVDRLVTATAAIASLSYMAYAVFGPTPWMVVTVPFVLVGLARYLRLAHRGLLGESPEEILLTDAIVLGSVTGWIVSAAFVLLVV